MIENVQRENLDPIEQAKAFKRLAEEFNHTQEEISAIVGKDRTVVANTLRLLNLPEDVQFMIADGAISAGHGKVLVGIEDEAKLRELVEKIVSESLSVRDIEGLSSKSKVKNKKKNEKIQEIELSNLVEELQRKFGSKVFIKGSSKKGKIEINYYSLDDLERISNLLKNIN